MDSKKPVKDDSSRPGAGARVRQIDPGSLNYRLYTITDGSTVTYGQLLITNPSNQTKTYSGGNIYRAGEEYWFLTTNLPVTSGATVRFSWGADASWPATDPMTGQTASFVTSQTTAWSRMPVSVGAPSAPTQAASLYICTTPSSYVLGLSWAVQVSSNTWTGSLTWYSATTSLAFAGQSSPVTMTSNSAVPSPAAWYQAVSNL